MNRTGRVRQVKVASVIGLMLIVAGCSSNPHKAEQIETKMETSAPVQGEQVGIKDGNMVIQKKTALTEELRRLQNEVLDLEEKVYGNRKLGSMGLYGELRDCRKQISDKRLGGDGKFVWTEPMDRLTDKEQDLKVGLDEDKKLVAVSEDYTKDRITRFQEYKKNLIKKDEDFSERLSGCKSDLVTRKAEMAEKAEAAKAEKEKK